MEDASQQRARASSADETAADTFPITEEQVYRESLVQYLFDLKAETVCEDYSCALLRSLPLHGRMYLTAGHLCFYSNLFGTETKLKLPLSTIASFRRTRTVWALPNAIEVRTNAGQTTVFTGFSNVNARDVCLARLSSLHADVVARDGELELPASTQVPSSRSGRGASLPLGHEAEVEAQALTTTPESKERRRSVAGASADARPRTSSATPNASEADGNERAEASTPMATGSRQAPSAGGAAQQSPQPDAPERFAQELWRGFHELDKILEVELECGLEDFFAAFLADDAPCSWGEVQRLQGDTEIDLASWSASAEHGQQHGRSRELRFRKKLKNPPPFVKKSTMVFMTQRLRVVRSGPEGDSTLSLVSLDCVSRTPDVPYGDCFHIEERWLIEALPQSSGIGASGAVVSSETPDGSEAVAPPKSGPRCRVSAAAVVQFTKSTMWRRMIQEKSRAGLKEQTEEWLRIARRHLHSAGKVSQEIGENAAVASAETSSSAIDERQKRHRRRRHHRSEGDNNLGVALAVVCVLTLVVAAFVVLLNRWQLQRNAVEIETLLSEVIALRRLVEENGNGAEGNVCGTVLPGVG